MSSEADQQVALGKYLHFKGNPYQVIGEGFHTETNEEVVIYRPLYDTPGYTPGTFCVRPKAMFLATVEVDGQIVPRFKYIGDANQ